MEIYFYKLFISKIISFFYDFCVISDVVCWVLDSLIVPFLVSMFVVAITSKKVYKYTKRLDSKGKLLSLLYSVFEESVYLCIGGSFSKNWDKIKYDDDRLSKLKKAIIESSDKLCDVYELNCVVNDKEINKHTQALKMLNFYILNYIEYEKKEKKSFQGILTSYSIIYDFHIYRLKNILSNISIGEKIIRLTLDEKTFFIDKEMKYNFDVVESTIEKYNKDNILKSISNTLVINDFSDFEKMFKGFLKQTDQNITYDEIFSENYDSMLSYNHKDYKIYNDLKNETFEKIKENYELLEKYIIKNYKIN